MKRFFFPTVILTIVILLFITVSIVSASANKFQGSWHGTDIDGSNLTLRVTPSGWSNHRLLSLRGTDNYTGSWCGGSAKMEGFGVLEDENTLSASIAWWCLDPVENILFPLSITFTYDSATDTLTDSWGGVYYRE